MTRFGEKAFSTPEKVDEHLHYCQWYQLHKFKPGTEVKYVVAWFDEFDHLLFYVQGGCRDLSHIGALRWKTAEAAKAYMEKTESEVHELQRKGAFEEKAHHWKIFKIEETASITEEATP